MMKSVSNSSLSGLSRAVGVFRLQLFKPSEVFVSAQAEALTRYEPIYIGRKMFGLAPRERHIAVADRQSKLRARLGILSGSSTPYVRALSGRHLDLIHAHFAIDGVYALRLAQRLSCPLITTLHGFDVTTSDSKLLKSGRVPWIRYLIGRRSLQRHGDLFICVSEFIRDQAIRVGFPASKIEVHHIGTELPPFGERREQAVPTILHVARLVEKKGTRYLIEAASAMRAKGIGFRLRIIGDGPLRGDLERTVKRLKLEPLVEFMGVRTHDEVLDALRSSSLLALPSITATTGDAEGLGMVLLEAASLGVPVVASRSGGISEAVKDGETGFLVRERDSESLEARMTELLLDPKLRALMGECGRRFVEKNFDIGRQTAKLEKIYDRVVAAAPRDRRSMA